LNYQIVISGGYSSKAGWLKDVQMLQSYDPDCTSVSIKNKNKTKFKIINIFLKISYNAIIKDFNFNNLLYHVLQYYKIFL